MEKILDTTNLLLVKDIKLNIGINECLKNKSPKGVEIQKFKEMYSKHYLTALKYIHEKR